MMALRWTDWAGRTVCATAAVLCVIGAAGAAWDHALFWMLFELLAAAIWAYNLHRTMQWPRMRQEWADMVESFDGWERDDAATEEIRRRLNGGDAA